jgi:hypothetical protein
MDMTSTGMDMGATSTGAMPSSTAMSGMDMGGMDMGGGMNHGGNACKISVSIEPSLAIIPCLT